jgi:hypothetical protein
MGILAIQVNDKKSVVIEYEDGRKVKYLYNRVLSEHPGTKSPGVQMEMNFKEGTQSGNQS